MCERYALWVAEHVRLPEADFCLLSLVEQLEGAADRHEHAGVVGPQFKRPLIVVEWIVVHFEDLMGLAETVPGAEIPSIYVCNDGTTLHSTRLRVACV